MSSRLDSLRKRGQEQLTTGLLDRLQQSRGRLERVHPPQSEGRLSRLTGLTFEAEGLRLPMGGARTDPRRDRDGRSGRGRRVPE